MSTRPSMDISAYLPPAVTASLVALFSVARFEAQRWVRSRNSGMRGSSELTGFFVDTTFGIASTFGILFLAAFLWDYGWQSTVIIILVSLIAVIACWLLMVMLARQVSWFGLVG